VNVQRSTLNAQRSSQRSGSALIIALWTIGLLAMLVMSFALDAMLEGKINVYVKQRRQVDYLTQSGIAIAEMLLLDYPNATPAATPVGGAASAPSASGEDEDKWRSYKLDLQRGSCRVGAYPVDPDRPDEGAVTVEIAAADVNKWPINGLITKSDVTDQIWENILNVIGLPMEYQEEVVDSFYDWVDADGTVTGRSGAEDEYYDGLENKTLNGKRLKMPRNGPLTSIAELEMIRGIREHPAIFNGGPLEPDKKSRFKKDKKDEVVIQYGLKAFFDIYDGDPIINVNSASMELLMTVPGIDGDVDLAGAIVQERQTGENRLTSYDAGSESLLFKDWSDLNARIPGGVPSSSERFLTYGPKTYFEIKVTGEAGGISHQIKAVAIVEKDRVRYLRWREDP
jgi:hypothetical protein